MRRRLVALLAGSVVLLPLAPLVRAAPAPAAEKWALVIGINDYAGRTVDTIGSVGDAQDVTKALRDNGWPADHIITLLDGEATAAKIRAGMRFLVEKSSPTSFSVFHYSGHTKQFDGVPDAEGADEYLWSALNEFISDNEFTHEMRAVRGRLWANVSNCESAGFDDGFSGPEKLFTAASMEDEKGYEEPAWNRSVFTGLMVSEGILKGSGDANGDKRVSLDEAFAYAEKIAPQMTANEKPYGAQHPYRAGGGGEWFLSAPPPAEVPDLPAPVRDLPVVKDLPVEDLLPLLPVPDPPPGTPGLPPPVPEQPIGTPEPAPLPPLPEGTPRL